jgi:uncharacterized protein YndB with AHSA1/START domain
MGQSAHELSISRYIAAPPDKVWDILANRQEEWWCPRPWSVKIDRQDRSAGGVCNMTMHGPDGEVSPQNGIYLAYDEGRRFISTDAVTGDFIPAGPLMIGIWEIAPEGDGTRYTATARHWTAEACDEHAAMGFAEGWGVCAEQLAELCEAV